MRSILIFLFLLFRFSSCVRTRDTLKRCFPRPMRAFGIGLSFIVILGCCVMRTSSLLSSRRTYSSVAENDRIESLPGLDSGDFQRFNMFSGFVGIGDNDGDWGWDDDHNFGGSNSREEGSRAGRRDIFYWLVESEDNPAEDPVVFWSNGGKRNKLRHVTEKRTGFHFFTCNFRLCARALSLSLVTQTSFS